MTFRPGSLRKTFLIFPILIHVHLVMADPIRLHPDNPRWFEYRGRATALITSGEHYGAVLNLDYDFHTYLDTLDRDGMNYTRIFSGTYVEPEGAFKIERNTLAPARGRFIAPWARSEKPGYANGGNRFDLYRFSPEYLVRLKGFIAEADRRGVVIELTLFCSTYREDQWKIHPLNPANNIQAYPVDDWRNINTISNSPDIMAVQERLVRYLVRELNGFDNLFYEIQNEPYGDNSLLDDTLDTHRVNSHKWANPSKITAPDSVAWQRVIGQVITDEERNLPKKHLIAQNVANFRLTVSDDDLVPEASVINFHYDYPEVVDWNRGLNRLIGFDESGFAGSDDTTYRRQAWEFVLSGGGLFNNLDYSFTVGYEDGQDTANEAPGGGSPALRRQLKLLSDFLHGFKLEKLNPDYHVVHRAPGVVVRVLSEPGRQYAIYLRGRGPTTLQLNLRRGIWQAAWISTLTGEVIESETIRGGSKPVSIASPDFPGEIALRLTR